MKPWPCVSILFATRITASEWIVFFASVLMLVGPLSTIACTISRARRSSRTSASIERWSTSRIFSAGAMLASIVVAVSRSMA